MDNFVSLFVHSLTNNLYLFRDIIGLMIKMWSQSFQRQIIVTVAVIRLQFEVDENMNYLL